MASYRCRGEALRFVTTKRGLSLGSRPGWRTTSALMITRRRWAHVPAGVVALAVDVSGLPRFARQTPGGTHQACGAPLQYLIFTHRDHVLESLAFEEGEDLGSGEAAIETHPQSYPRERRPQPRQEPRQYPDCSDRSRGIAGAQYIGEQVLLGLLVEGQEPSHRQVAPGVVVAVEEGELLRAMSRIVRRVQVNRDPLDLALQAPAMSLDHSVGEGNTHPVQIRPLKGVLEARQGRLRGQVLAIDRVAITEQLLDRIRSQSARIIGIRVAARNRIQTLAHQIPDRMADLARLASVIDAADQRLGQTEATVARLQQDRSAIGTGVFLIKLRDYRLTRQIRKQNTLSCAIVIHAKASFVRETACGKAFLSRSRPLCFSISNRFANNVG